MAKEPQFTPDTDGIDHINILASKAKTLLGKRLSHFAPMPFVHPYFGSFMSMEGFWHYAATGYEHDELRHVSGFEAKKLGRTYKKEWYDEHRDDVLAANWQKIIQNHPLAMLMAESELPFTHYYVFSPDDNPGVQIVKTPRESEWLCKGFEKIRTALKEGSVPDFWLEAADRYALNMSCGRPAWKSRA